MAASVTSRCADPLASGYWRPGVLRSEIGLGEVLELDFRDALEVTCREWEATFKYRREEKKLSSKDDHTTSALPLPPIVRLRLNGELSAPHQSPPPPYEDSVFDAPPDYTDTESLVTARLGFDPECPPPPYRTSRQPTEPRLLLRDPTPKSAIDFSATDHFRTHGKKKAKAAAKKAQSDKWGDDDDEEKPPGEDGEHNGDSGGGGDDNGGGAGGGDDGDDWNDGGKKKKGKKKKNAFSWDEDEDEEQKKQEEEDAALATSN
ncbi:hypothetical protein B0A49_08104, partial [Cryomyces minteri]